MSSSGWRKQKDAPKIGAPLKVAGSQGFEPRQTVPKTVVLPLHHEPVEVRNSRKAAPLVKYSVQYFSAVNHQQSAH